MSKLELDLTGWLGSFRKLGCSAEILMVNPPNTPNLEHGAEGSSLQH
jgi:hypothetical protein